MPINEYNALALALAEAEVRRKGVEALAQQQQALITELNAKLKECKCNEPKDLPEAEQPAPEKELDKAPQDVVESTED